MQRAGDWPNLARSAAVYLTTRAADETLTSGVELLCHVRDAFDGEPYIATSTLLDRLRDRDESPWKDIRGKPLDPHGLAKRLKGYGIKSKTVRIEGKTPKGYDAADFADPWRRYLPSALDVRHKGNSRHIFDNKNNFVADVADVAGGIAEGNDDNVVPFKADGDPFASLKSPSHGLQPKPLDACGPEELGAYREKLSGLSARLRACRPLDHQEQLAS